MTEPVYTFGWRWLFNSEVVIPCDICLQRRQRRPYWWSISTIASGEGRTYGMVGEHFQAYVVFRTWRGWWCGVDFAVNDGYHGVSIATALIDGLAL